MLGAAWILLGLRSHVRGRESFRDSGARGFHPCLCPPPRHSGVEGQDGPGSPAASVSREEARLGRVWSRSDPALQTSLGSSAHRRPASCPSARGGPGWWRGRAWVRATWRSGPAAPQNAQDARRSLRGPCSLRPVTELSLPPEPGVHPDRGLQHPSLWGASHPGRPQRAGSGCPALCPASPALGPWAGEQCSWGSRKGRRAPGVGSEALRGQCGRGARMGRTAILSPAGVRAAGWEGRGHFLSTVKQRAASGAPELGTWPALGPVDKVQRSKGADLSTRLRSGQTQGEEGAAAGPGLAPSPQS